MVQVHSGPLPIGVIAQLVERQLCKLDVRSSSLLSSRTRFRAHTRVPPRACGTLTLRQTKTKNKQLN